MKIKTSVLLAVIVLHISILHAQVYQQAPKTNDVIKPGHSVIAEYSGGRFGFSAIYLTLYSDSTYDYSSWIHIGETYEDKGRFARKGNKIWLNSDTAITMKDLMKHEKTFYVFSNEKYRMKDNKIFLYSRWQQLFDRADYYEAYLTLYKSDPARVKQSR